jgi:hypothetical protein
MRFVLASWTSSGRLSLAGALAVIAAGAWQAVASPVSGAAMRVRSGRPIPSMELTASAMSALRDSRPTFTVKMPRDINTGYVGFFDDDPPGPGYAVAVAVVAAARAARYMRKPPKMLVSQVRRSRAPWRCRPARP